MPGYRIPRKKGKPAAEEPAPTSEALQRTAGSSETTASSQPSAAPHRTGAIPTPGQTAAAAPANGAHMAPSRQPGPSAPARPARAPGGRLPDGWPQSSKGGAAIGGLVPVKTPLSSCPSFDNQLPPAERWTPMDCIQACGGRRVGLVIDLTNTQRYYSPQELPQGVRHLKLSVEGHALPSSKQLDHIARDIEAVFDANAQAHVVIHCTHGHNRTGYVIAHFLCSRRKRPLHEVLAELAHIRPPGLWRAEYVRALHDEFGGPAPIYPEPPAWGKKDWRGAPPAQSAQSVPSAQPASSSQLEVVSSRAEVMERLGAQIAGGCGGGGGGASVGADTGARGCGGSSGGYAPAEPVERAAVGAAPDVEMPDARDEAPTSASASNPAAPAPAVSAEAFEIVAKQHAMRTAASDATEAPRGEAAGGADDLRERIKKSRDENASKREEAKRMRRADALPPRDAEDAPRGERARLTRGEVSDGAIYLCDDSTESECLARGLLGSRSGNGGVAVGTTRLFLFNTASKVVSGPFVATEPMRRDIVPDAFASRGAFPFQARRRLIGLRSSRDAAETRVGAQVRIRPEGDARRARQLERRDLDARGLLPYRDGAGRGGKLSFKFNGKLAHRLGEALLDDGRLASVGLGDDFTRLPELDRPR